MSSVEILLATFNSETFIEEQVDSIFSQTDQDWHLTIQDGGSRDRTVSIVKKIASKYEKKITFIQHDNGHLSAKKNFGSLLSKAHSPLYMFCDQDDVWFKNKVELTKDFYYSLHSKNEKQPVLIFTDSVVTDNKLIPLSNSFLTFQNLNPRKLALNNLLLQNVAPGNTMLFNNSLKELALPIPSQAIMHDHWLILICSIFGRIRFLDSPTLFYRQHGNNVVGATKFSFLSILKKTLNNSFNMEGSLTKDFEQAEAIYKLYEQDLPQESKEILKLFINVRKQTFFQRRISLLEGGFLKHGFIRNLGLFFLI